MDGECVNHWLLCIFFSFCCIRSKLFDKNSLLIRQILRNKDQQRTVRVFFFLALCFNQMISNLVVFVWPLLCLCIWQSHDLGQMSYQNRTITVSIKTSGQNQEINSVPIAQLGAILKHMVFIRTCIVMGTWLAYNTPHFQPLCINKSEGEAHFFCFSEAQQEKTNITGPNDLSAWMKPNKTQAVKLCGQRVKAFNMNCVGGATVLHWD